MRERLLVAVLAALLAIPAAFSPTAAAATGDRTVIQLDVGQNDAAIFRGPCADIGLVDAGQGSADDIRSALAGLGTANADWLASYDADHIGGVADLENQVEVPVVYDRGGGPTAKDTATYDAYAGARQHTAVDIGAVLRLCPGADEVTFTVVSAGTDGTVAGEVPASKENDRGLCLLVEFVHFDIATCGDVNGTDEGSRSNVESAVAGRIGDVEVAKVNHHGSAFSSNQAYVETLDAEAALISVGNNAFGHPSTVVVDRWEASGATVYLTGVAAADLGASGDITVSTDGNTRYAVRTEFGGPTQSSELDDNPGSGPQPVQPLPVGTAAPRAIDDSCPGGQFPDAGFIDVAAANVHEIAIDCMVWWRVANGRSTIRYAPGDGVRRDAMASFVARAIGETNLPASPPDAFGDDGSSVHQHAINQIAAAGIVGGTGGGNYSPGRVVTRGQMARLMANAAAYQLAGDLPVTHDFFDDDAGHIFEADINKAAQAGITGGQAARSYAPGAAVSRDQMASFLARLLDLFAESGARQTPAPVTIPYDPGDEADCDDFATQSDAQAYHDRYFSHYGDVANLDADGDGVACEMEPPPPLPYAGLGTWIDVYDWSRTFGKDGPLVEVGDIDRMADLGVQTLYVQTSRWNASADVLEPERLLPLIERARARGMGVVAWYLPTLVDPATDLRRLLAAAELDVDAVAVDIESRDVADVAERNARLVQLSRDLRSARPQMALGGIVFPPVVMDVINTSFWPDFPWKELAPLYDVWLPMAYQSYRTEASGYRDGHRYTAENIDRLRANLGLPAAPVHTVGGIADATTTADVDGMVAAAAERGAVGGSLYDWRTTSAALWPHLQPFRR